MPSPNNNRDLLKYAGLTTQIFIALGLGVFFGMKLDSWLHISFPVMVWALPLLIIVSLIIKLIKDTNRKR
jgi:Na+/glutamate symporter